MQLLLLIRIFGTVTTYTLYNELQPLTDYNAVAEGPCNKLVTVKILSTGVLNGMKHTT